MRRNKYCTVIIVLILCVIPFLSRLIRREPNLPMASVAGRWGLIGAPLITQAMHSANIPVGKPSVQLVLNNDGTGAILVRRGNAHPVRWGTQGEQILIIDPHEFADGNDMVGEASLSPDGRSLTVTTVTKEPEDAAQLWRIRFGLEKPSVGTDRYEKL